MDRTLTYLTLGNSAQTLIVLMLLLGMGTGMGRLAAGPPLARSSRASAMPSSEKSPIYVYARPGDPLRFVWSVKGERSMGIIGEGPLRARCFVLDNYYRELTLTGPAGECYEPRCPRTVETLASRLDLEREEVPDGLVRIWRDGAVEWSAYDPGERVPVEGVTPSGPYLLVGHQTYRIFDLAPGRGSLVVCYYGPGMTRVLRVRAPSKEYVIRPKVGLEAMMQEQRLVRSDICGHLRDIHEGRPVDWTQIRGYTYE